MDGGHDAAHLARLLQRVTDHAVGYLTSTAHGSTAVEASAVDLRAALGGDLPAVGVDPAELLERFVTAAEPGLARSTSGRYFGFVTGGAFPVAVATE
ncbi:hypothetical protein [Frankia sp. R82]|uniref:hypothetical protein n=1 Tax=Frankia sp. R82 TaxID=2950553 RepID=UPI002043ABDC|nr:hypothetical protein [Frankia sp. R82]MCM3883262.1 hypothetical protein [Frankia sp. R82]